MYCLVESRTTRVSYPAAAFLQHGICSVALLSSNSLPKVAAFGCMYNRTPDSGGMIIPSGVRKFVYYMYTAAGDRAEPSTRTCIPGRCYQNQRSHELKGVYTLYRGRADMTAHSTQPRTVLQQRPARRKQAEDLLGKRLRSPPEEAPKQFSQD